MSIRPPHASSKMRQIPWSGFALRPKMPVPLISVEVSPQKSANMREIIPFTGFGYVHVGSALIAAFTEGRKHSVARLTCVFSLQGFSHPLDHLTEGRIIRTFRRSYFFLRQQTCKLHDSLGIDFDGLGLRIHEREYSLPRTNGLGPITVGFGGVCQAKFSSRTFPDRLLSRRS